MGSTHLDKETECLQILKQKIKDDESLDHFTSLLEDRFLLHFVRGRKCKADRAFDTLQRYIRIRSEKYKDFFLEIVPSKLRIKEFAVRPLKNLGPNGQLIIVSTPGWWPHVDQASDTPMDDIIQKLIVVIEQIWNYETAEANGVEAILGFTGFTWRHAKVMMSVSHLIKGLSIFYKAFPMKYKKLHYLNPPMYFKMVHSMMKPLAPAKLIARVHLHEGNFETLHQQLPKDILPDWMGGTLSDEEAFDTGFHEFHSSPENDEYYKRFIEKLKLI